MKMFATERKNTIMNILQEKKRITVKVLTTETGVSEATLRTDLNEMEINGQLVRTHGGAMLKEDAADTSFQIRSQQNIEEKNEIAKLAFAQIHENNVYY